MCLAYCSIKSTRTHFISIDSYNHNNSNTHQHTNVASSGEE